jgi:hypothetical protein
MNGRIRIAKVGNVTTIYSPVYKGKKTFWNIEQTLIGDFDIELRPDEEKEDEEKA